MAKKILVVDDEEDIRELVIITLEDEGYEMHEATNGEEAVEKAKELKPDLMVLDVMMPGLTGYEVCEELKGEAATSGIKIVLLSARGSPTAERTGKAKGADAYMVKPFEPAELRGKIKEILGD